jgi:outer membrane protein OmpA-like peptidoglycan-associated protein
MPSLRWLLVLAALVTAGAATPADAQLPKLKKVKDAVKKVGKIAGDAKSADSAAAKPADSAAAKPAEAGAGASNQPPAKADTAKPAARKDAKIWENYDFIPGNKVIFYTDFTEDKVGNFARGLKYVSGPIEVVERDGAKVLRSIGRSQFLIPVGRQLPERFTLEIDVIAPEKPCCGYEVLNFEGGPTLNRGDKSAEIIWHPGGTMIFGSGQNANSAVKIPDAMQPALMGNVAHIRALMDGPYFKLYTNERRMYNIPELAFRRDSVIRVFVNGDEEDGMAVFVTRIRVAESETDVLYDALAAKGRWSTQGILFATGKADLQPESRPVLKEIAATLKDHADLKILIEGHTDNVGTPASNLTLSDARAAAVKTALVADFGVNADQITTKGMGDTKPTAPNTTAAGRAQNRRVDIVKQ